MESPLSPQGSRNLAIPGPFNLRRLRDLLMTAVEDGRARRDSEYLEHLALLMQRVSEPAREPPCYSASQPGRLEAQSQSTCQRRSAPSGNLVHWIYFYFGKELLGLTEETGAPVGALESEIGCSSKWFM